MKFKISGITIRTGEKTLKVFRKKALHPQHVINAVAFFPGSLPESPRMYRIFQDAEEVFASHLKRAQDADDIRILNGCYHNDV